jgi:hypothetical protein
MRECQSESYKDQGTKWIDMRKPVMASQNRQHRPTTLHNSLVGATVGTRVGAVEGATVGAVGAIEGLEYDGEGRSTGNDCIIETCERENTRESRLEKRDEVGMGLG